MLICFTTDLHGRINLYTQAAGLVRRTRPDLLILGGDMLPDGDMSNPCPAQTGFVRGWFADWLGRLRDEVPTCRVATVFGNHDWRCSVEAMDEVERAGLITVLRPDRPAEFDGWTLLGYSYSPPSPFYSKDLERLDLSTDAAPVSGGGQWDPERGAIVEAPSPGYFKAHPTIEEDLADVPTVEGRWIFVSHAPPFESGLDLLISGQPVGSRAIRRFIEQRAPMIALHGHLHDSPFKSGRFCERIGQTVCINPGQGTSDLAAVTFDADDVAGTIQPYGVRLPDDD